MPRVAKELSALEVRRLTTPGYHSVGGVPGLLLQVMESGSRSWVLRVMVAGKRREIGLGSYPAVSLALAREKAQAMRDEIAAGTDPVSKRKSNRQALHEQQEAEKRLAWTFYRCAEKFIDVKKPGWRNAKHAQQWHNTLASYAYPLIGDMAVASIRVEHIMQVVEPHWTTKNETMNRVRNRIEQVLDWAAVHGYREQVNPARWRGCIDKLLPKPSDVAPVEHHPAMPAEGMYEFMRRLRAITGVSARCLEFVVLTACRSGAARLATWDEIDWKNRVWNIPAEPGRKMKRPLRVPLSDPAIALLKSVPQGEGEALIFPHKKGQPLSDMALTELMRGMALDAVPHGFRSTFSSWAASSTAYPSEVREMALGHTVGSDTVRAYQRDDLFVKRVSMMADWAAFINASPHTEQQPI
ncbi:tyrosine-type recombinase/integrase [Massilia sp. SYSU DXS3249]